MTEHPRSRTLTNDGGWSFVELVTAVAIVGVALLVMLQQMTISYRETELSMERVFAYEKALAMLAEIQSAVERRVAADAVTLETYDDQGAFNPVLTTLRDGGAVVSPEHVASGNVRRRGDWLWWRRISVDPVPSSDQMRYVRITLHRRTVSGTRLVAASIGAVVNLPVEAFPATQSHDLYVLAIGAAPGLSGSIESMRRNFASAAGKLQAHNPGLRFRTHWITKFGYGRDERYAPFVNASGTPGDAAPWAYWYPTSTVAASKVYTPELISGRLQNGVSELGGYHAVDNPVPHAVADRFNHCMRAPRARRKFAERVLAGLEDPDEPPLQILLEDMIATPEKFANAIFLNLHGEALPCPPLRNVSDAASSPAALPGVRAVTHPERLWTPRDPDGNANHDDSLDAVFRVYGYKTDPSVGSEIATVPITLQILGVDLTGDINGGSSTTLDIERLKGDSGTGYSNFNEAKSLAEGPNATEMYFVASYVTTPVPATVIELHRTPLKCVANGNRGLGASERLYGMEYIPSPVLADGSFDRDLEEDTYGAQPTNTARWRITIPKRLFEDSVWVDEDTVITVVTRLGNDLTTGTMWPAANDPSNRTETYTWWAETKDAVPATERYQFQGDPRLMPYADSVVGGDGFAHGYNWFFDDLSTGGYSTPAGDWPCLDLGRLQDSGLGGSNVDVPRFLGLWREALQACGAILSHTDGAIASALVLGGEVVVQRDVGSLEPRSLAVHGDWFGVASARSFNSIAGSAIVTPPAAAPGPGAPPSVSGETLVVDSLSSFWAKPWLGELAPDGNADWNSVGNLATPRFRRTLRSAATLSGLPSGTSFANDGGTWFGQDGAVTFFQSDVGQGGPLTHVPAALVASMKAQFEPEIDEFLELLAIHPQQALHAGQPFEFGTGPTSPGHWGESAVYPMHFVSPLETTARVDGDLAGSVLSVAPPGASDPAAYVSLLGLTPQTPISRIDSLGAAIAMGLRALYVAASPSATGDVAPPVSVSVLNPTPDQVLPSPTSIVLRWRTAFRRFDGKPYTSAYGPGYVGSEVDLGYVVLLSRDQGATWTHAVDGTAAVPGAWVPTSSPYWQPDAGPGDESFALALPAATFPSGYYLVRIDGYSSTRETHCSHHRLRFVIKR